MKTFHKLESAEREGIADIIRDILEKESDILFAFLFGSFIDAVVFRDIDLGVFIRDAEAASFTDFELALCARIEDALPQAIPVDVRIVNRAPLSFRFTVIRGQLLFSRADPILEEFMVATARRYLDFFPLRQRYVKEAMIS